LQFAVPYPLFSYFHTLKNFAMTAIDILGMTAGCISSITFLPQVIKTWKTKSAADISLLMFTFATISVIMWLVYGIILQNIPIIFTNSMVLLFSLIMLYFKFRYSSQRDREMQNVKELVADEN
jgi:MtN3 and saliva related transmembrane protein